MSLKRMVIIAVVASVVAVGIIGGLVWALAVREKELIDHPQELFSHNCNLAELYNAEFAAVQMYGTNLEGAVQGSDWGCVPVCVFTYPTLSDPADAASSAAELADLSLYALTLNENLARSELLTLTEAEAETLAAAVAVEGGVPAASAGFTRRLAQALAAIGPKVSGKSVLFETPTSVYYGVDTGIAVAEVAETMLRSGRIADVKVAPNQDTCYAHDDARGKIVDDDGVLLVPAGGRIAEE